MGLLQVEAIRTVNLFFLAHPQLTDEQVETLAATLLADPLVEQFRWAWVDPYGPALPANYLIEVEFLPGVTDRVAAEIKTAAQRLGLSALQVTTGHRYHIFVRELPPADLQRLAQQVLCNEVVQHYHLGQITPTFVTDIAAAGLVERINLAHLDDEELLLLSQERHLALNLAEMVAQTWSEHCYHKTFKAQIHYLKK
jgi:phosphoribosylformylglycinamidine synthase